MHPYSSPVSDFTELRAPARRPAPVLKLVARAQNKPRPRFLFCAEKDRLIRSLGECRNPLVLAVALLVLESGLLLSELLQNVRWGDIDWKGNCLVLNGHKNDDFGNRIPAVVRLSVDAMEILWHLKPGRRGEVIFDITQESFNRSFKRACERAAIKPANVSEMRLVERLTGPRRMGRLDAHSLFTSSEL